MDSLNAKQKSSPANNNATAQYTQLRSRSFQILAGLSALLLGSTLHAATLTRTSSFTYNPTTGLLETETIEPDNAALRLVTTYTYDDFGNRITATVSGSDIVTRTTTTTTYDAQGRFPVTAKNALDHSETRVFDARFGTVTQVTGPNGLVSNFTFDNWGRLTNAKPPDGASTSIWRGTCPTSGCPTHAAYYIAFTKPGTPTTVTYLDKYNRELRKQTFGFNGNHILRDTAYDALGRVASVSHPYYTGESIALSNFTYDVLNRVLTDTAPSGGATNYAYNGYTTTVTDALSHSRTSVKNSQGQLISITDANNNTISYAYDPFGNLFTTTDPASNVTILTYDLRGRKTGMNDPDMGVWSYTYNVLGELITQTDAKQQITSYSYDLLGRMLTRTEPDLVTSWGYDTATKGIGKLARTSTDNGQIRTFYYDSLGRLTTTSTLTGIIGAPVLNVITTYDSVGRVDTQIDPAGNQVQNVYNDNGYLSQVRNALTLQVYWTAGRLSADGQLTSGIFGNYVMESRGIDNQGRTMAVNTSGAVTALSYTYDTVGNLTTRTDATQNLTESYGYDALNRLTSVSSSNPNQVAKLYFYDSLGNIFSKSDTGSYSYAALRIDGTNRPHAVSAVAGSWNTSFSYDANGNMLSGGDRTYTYTSYNLPSTITRSVPSNGTTTILYGSDHERAKVTDPDGTVTITLNPRLDSGAHYDQRTHPNGVVEKINYIYAGNRPIGIYSINANGVSGNNTLRYFHVDAQGSIVAITNEAGATVERLSYDAWGKRRNPNGTDNTTHNLQAVNTDHGYTGHEHLDAAGLIHMNGRVYDPRLGRFIEADPHIQSPGNLQSFNRYSYVRNNPFFYTDPSGYSYLGDRWEAATGTDWSDSRDQYVRPVVAIVASAYLGPIVYAGWGGGLLGGAISGATVGLTSGAIIGGNLDSAQAGAGSGLYSGAAFGAVGNIAQAGNWGRAATIGANSLTGGAMARVQGGDFVKGMEYMFVTQAAAWGYEKEMGYAANPNPGTNDPNHTTYQKGTIPPEEMNTIGNNSVQPDGSVAFFDQGGTGSRALNKIPVFNALSKPHDVWTDTFTSSFSNVVLMVPAAAFTYIALMPAPLTVELSVKRKY